MKGDADVIELLNECLTAELTAINQYYVHSKMCSNWGYPPMAKKKMEEAMEEMHHADWLIERILFLEGIPNMQRLFAVKVGESVPEQHELDLELERANQDRLNKGIELCRTKGDNNSRLLLEKILHEEEQAIDWLETQLALLAELGPERYLAQQIRSS